MNRKIVRRVLAMLIVSVICSAKFSFSTYAVSDGTTGSITLTTFDAETNEAISGAVFRLYFLANCDITGDDISYTYSEAFKDNGMEMGNFGDEYLPIHLASYAEANGIPYIEKATDTEGIVVFDNLYGAYLIVPAGMKEGYLKPNAFIVSVPMKDERENKWIYNIDASPKIESSKEENVEKTYISVKKYWKSTGTTPDSVIVSLVKDGTDVESVVLNEENNWYYRWDDLDKKHSWNVIEKEVPKDYTASYTTSQMTVMITNTADDYEEETTIIPEDSTEAEELIQTGQLNWPVPVCTIAGLLLFSIGWAMLNLGEKDEETV